MTAATLTLADFLRDRIAEDEAIIRAAYEQAEGIAVLDVIPTEPIAIYEERFGPWSTRLLAECEAKRRIVELHGWMGPVMAGDPVDDPKSCTVCVDEGHRDWQGSAEPEPWPCRTLRHVASVCADHPDFRPEWRA